MTRHWPYAALAMVAAAAALVWPITAAIPVRDAVTARAASATLAILVCVATALYNRWGRRTAFAVTAISAAIGITLLLMHFDSLSACIVEFEGRPVLVGRVYTPLGRNYLEGSPDSSSWDLLDVTAGAPDLAWTAESIRQCRLLVSWAGLAALPFLAGSIGMFMSHRQYAFAAFRPVTASTALDAGIRPIYDVFMSYRHLEP